MKVAILQYTVHLGDIEKNLALFSQRIADLEGKADVVLLPEMFTTGFIPDEKLTEPTDGKTIQTLQILANKHSLAITGSFMCKDNGKFYTRGFFIQPNQAPEFVDKRHLYRQGGEADFFTPGTKRGVFEYKGVKFLLIICYDLRFPVWNRNQTGHDYDIILVTANWPQMRIEYWDVLVQARAIENQSLVCAVNIVGEDIVGLHYNGHSVAYNSHLAPIVKFEDNEEGTKIAELNVDKLHHFREVLPLWKDADIFALE